jgi:hypothetical protein
VSRFSSLRPPIERRPRNNATAKRNQSWSTKNEIALLNHEEYASQQERNVSFMRMHSESLATLGAVLTQTIIRIFARPVEIFMWEAAKALQKACEAQSGGRNDKQRVLRNLPWQS